MNKKRYLIVCAFFLSSPGYAVNDIGLVSVHYFENDSSLSKSSENLSKDLFTTKEDSAMPKEIAVAIIHGMGNQTQQEYQDTCDALQSNLRRNGVDIDRFAFKNIYWAEVLNGRQGDYLEKAQRSGAFDSFGAWLAWNDLRVFVVDFLADVAAYRRLGDETGNNPQGSASGTYIRIHRTIEKCLRELHNEVDGKDVPLIIIAHSLGGHIISNYIWDIQQKISVTNPGNNAFELMQTVTGLITFGCNIPLFTFAYPEDKVKPIAFPGDKLTPQQKAVAKWINVYDADDVLGYPLAILDSYAKAGFCEDKLINAGGLLTSWNPLSHTDYWTDDDFIEIVAEFLNKF